MFAPHHAAHHAHPPAPPLPAACSIWVVSSFISQSLVSDSADGTHKPKVPPFLLTYMATSLFTLYLPLVHGRLLAMDLWRSWRLRRRLKLG